MLHRHLHRAQLLHFRNRIISSLPANPSFKPYLLDCLSSSVTVRACLGSSNLDMEGSGKNAEVAVIGAGAGFAGSLEGCHIWDHKPYTISLLVGLQLGIFQYVVTGLSKVAGSVCASLLAEKGLAVKIFDSGRGPGGRMSQRREKVEDGSELMFDHGAQYFTVKSTEVQQLVDKWQAARIVADWEGRFGSLNVATRDFTEETAVKKRYVGVPGMHSICKALTTSPGVQTKYGVQVGGLEWTEESMWGLNSKDGESLGKFNAVVVADKGAAKLLLEGAGFPEMNKKVAAVTAAPCFAVMMAFPSPLTMLPYDGFLVEGSKIVVWAARDSSKPGRITSSRECWVVHSTVEYARGVIAQAGMGKPSNELLTAVANDLLTGFQSLVPNIPTPTYMKAHRWGGAFPTISIAPEEKCIVVEDRRIAVCGDFCVSPQVEGAIISGMHASERLGSLL